METVLAIDLGGSSLRAALVAPDGAITAIATRAHHTGIEADPELWWQMLLAATAELPPADVKAIIATGFTRSQVLVDAAGTVLRPAQCFPDTRAAAEAAALGDAAVAGSWLEMTPFHPLARLRWVQNHDPAAFARTRHVLQPKDYLALRITGIAASDRISNAWALERRGNMPALSLFRRTRLDAALLPPLRNPWDRIGLCQDLPRFDGLPVFSGAMDTWCASLGLGVAQAGDAYLVCGTTDAGGVLSDTPLDTPGLVTLPWGVKHFHTGGPSGGGADCAQWLAELLGLNDAGAVVALAATANPTAPPLLFLPALAGERAPTWQADARGIFLGLDRTHGAPEMARAVLEGVAFAARDLLGAASVERVMLGGGGARSDHWCQIRADVLGCQAVRSAADQPGLLGAAAVAWAGLGHYPSLAAAQAAMCHSDATFLPDPAAQPRYRMLFEHYKNLQANATSLTVALGRS